MLQPAGSNRQPQREWPTLEGVSFRPAEAHELPVCVEMLQEAFPRWPNQDLRATPGDYLDWELEKPGGDALAVVSEVDGVLGAFNVRFTRRFLVAGRFALVSEGADRAVAPRFQGRGVYRQSQRWALQYVTGYDLSMNFSRNPVILGNRQRRARENDSVYFDFGRSLQVLAKPLDVRLLARKEAPGCPLRQAVVLGGLTTLSAWARLRHARPRPAAPGTLAVSALERFDGLEETVSEATRQFDVVQLRDTQYLNWRYTDPRGGYATPTLVEEDGRALGFAVTSMSRNRGYLLDLMTLPGRDDAARALLDEAVRRLRAAGADSVVTWSSANHPLWPLLKRSGFLNTRRPTGISLRRREADDQMAAVLASPLSRVHLMPGDSTVI